MQKKNTVRRRYQAAVRYRTFYTQYAGIIYIGTELTKYFADHGV